MLQQATARAAPFMWQFIAFAHIAGRTGYHNIRWFIGTFTSKWNNMIDVPFCQFLMTPIALAFLALVLATNISNSKRAFSRLFPCASIIGACPTKFSRLFTVNVPIISVVRPYLLAVSFYISPLFLDMSLVVFSAPAPIFFCMVFTICLSAHSVGIFQFLLAMIGSKFFKMGFSIEGKAIFTFSTQSMDAMPLIRVKILQGSWLLLLTFWAVLVFQRSRSMSLNVCLRLSRRLFATLSRLTGLAVTCQPVFLAFVIVEVLKGRREIIITLWTVLQWYNIVHGKALLLIITPLADCSLRRGNPFLTELL